ncbi:unnamed protein product [Acanthoscelides obtectus]|uniref:Uncharacterized protein n=1 Tax=Acanthoscelides obtectus TaxID=200917 RepID=A0A9P0Q879_ACAOB|nr:unnamed protein product [Acanthoscelides obtectus]CAK1681771.1 hypothetical protein AOBTE_LOCUS33263 [Acanthoscelides obtectus]
MEEIEENVTNETVCKAACGIRRMLNDSVSVFWLTFFHHVMPHVDILFNQLQERKTEPAQVTTAIDNFEKCIVDLRNKIDDIINEAKSICTEPQANKRRRLNNSSHDHRGEALEVCDNIVNSANDRFQFKDHLVAASLFSPNILENTVVSLLMTSWKLPAWLIPNEKTVV